jgi:hypothetical protein
MDLSYHSRNAATANRLRERVKREGRTFNGLKVWSEEEDNKLRAHYPDYSAIASALPHRTYDACRARAREIGIVIRRPPFTARELSVIRRLYPSEERSEVLAALPGRDWVSVAKLASRHGIHRKPKPFKPTGVLVLDQIKERCRELNYSMSELDKMVRGKGYFRKASWCWGYLNDRDIGRAVRALFGDIKADWK